jgi:hypothetical protein
MRGPHISLLRGGNWQPGPEPPLSMVTQSRQFPARQNWNGENLTTPNSPAPPQVRTRIVSKESSKRFPRRSRPKMLLASVTSERDEM